MTPRSNILSILLLSTTLFSCGAFAATAEVRLPRLDVPHTDTAPVIDGDVSDEIWKQAAVIDHLSAPTDASPILPPVQATTIRVLWSETNLYVAYECQDTDIFTSGVLKHDEAIYDEDVVEVFLDGVGDGRQFVEVEVSPDSVTLDAIHVYSTNLVARPNGCILPEILKRHRWSFIEWEMPGVKAAAKRTATGWSAEFKIPAQFVVKRLGLDLFAPDMDLHAHFIRNDHLPALINDPKPRLWQQTWSPVLAGLAHISPSRMGTLHLLPATSK